MKNFCVKRIPFQRLLAALFVLTGCWIPASGSLIGFWRFDDLGAADGATISNTQNFAANGDLVGVGQSGPMYSLDVPGAYIFSPLSNTTLPNQLSMNATASGAGVLVPGNSAGDPLDTPSFTVEMFIKLDLSDLPTSFNYFANRRSGSPVEGWQIDYNAPFFSSGGANANAGRVRSRTDTLTAGNQVNTGALIDDGNWHHVALTFDSATSQMRIYTDYVLGQTRTITGTMSNVADLFIGSNGAFGLNIDEVRYHDAVLQPTDFLTALAVPEPSSFMLLLLGGLGLVRKLSSTAHAA